MFECVRICTVSDTLHALQRPAAVTICPARPVLYRVQTGAACLASWRVCRCAVSCMVCLASGTACPVQSCPVCCMGQGCTGGVYSRRPAPPGQSCHHRKNKKGLPHLHKTKPIRLCKSPNFPKNTKRPLSWSNLCYT